MLLKWSVWSRVRAVYGILAWNVSAGADIYKGRCFHPQVRFSHLAESTWRDRRSARQHHCRGVQGAASDRLLSADRNDSAQVQHHGNCRISERRRCQQWMWQDFYQRQSVALCQGLESNLILPDFVIASSPGKWLLKHKCGEALCESCGCM